MSDTEYQNAVKKDILFLLANEMLTSRQVEARLQLSYPTVRRAIVDLETEGEIIKFDRRSRNARYTLNLTKEAKQTKIPSIIFKGHTVPLTEVYLGQGIESLASGSADAILRAWTTIAVTADRLQDGVPDTILTKKLNAQKIHLANARINLEALVFVINQMLDNPKLWDAENLMHLPDSPNWDEFGPQLKDMYDHYYGNDNSE